MGPSGREEPRSIGNRPGVLPFRMLPTRGQADARCPNLGQPAVTFPPSFRSGLQSRRERGPAYGERTMAIVIEILLASCTFAFVTGIVIAAAKLVI